MRALTSFSHRLHGGAWKLLAPWSIGAAVLLIIPVFAVILMSLLDWNGLSWRNWRFVAFENYALALRDALFWRSLLNAVVYAAISVPLNGFLSLGLALLLNIPMRGSQILRAIVILPHLLGGTAAVMLWLWVMNPDAGPVNWLLKTLGIDQPLWFHSAVWAKPALALMNAWSIGGQVFIILAALQRVPDELREAAQLDGAGPWSLFKIVTWPHIAGCLLFNALMNVAGAFKMFIEAWLVTQGGTGPRDSMLFPAMHIFDQAFARFDLGYAAALAVIFAFICAVPILIAFGLSRRLIVDAHS